ncbi:MAG: DUF4830 domain-containing protein [Clostridium sp.]|nr:DUF4830 domain-containing protein [Clostridium sp.]
MLIVTAKLPRRTLALGGILAALALCVGTLLPSFSAAVPAAGEPAALSAPSPKKIRSNEDRVEYLSAYGWEVSPEPITTQELLIPEEMDESYTEYLSLQSQQGFDLAKYAGKRLKRYTYEIYNYPSGETGVQANLLLYRNTVVGGEVLSPQLNGFMHGLAMP